MTPPIRVLCPLAALGLLACGGSGESPKTPEPASTVAQPAPSSQPTAAPTPAPKPTPEPPRTAAPIATFGAPPPGTPEDYEMTFRDCDTLTANYEKLLRRDEVAKLEKKKLPKKVYERAKEQVEEVVVQGTASWRNQCGGIVGTIQVRSRIKCAEKADTIERFDGCMDGKFDGEPPEGKPPEGKPEEKKP